MPMNETDGLRRMSEMPQGGEDISMPSAPTDMGAPPVPTPMGTEAGVGVAPGGRGIDTPQEEKAMQMLVQAASLIREAANAEPSIRYIADKHLLGMFNDVVKHYGIEEQGKMALQQAQLAKRDEGAVRRAGPPGAPTGAPPAQAQAQAPVGPIA
uniref:Uncharacterized protein n=1 Tax=viral metagenome TaxID=1070528 RepID=A0A6M3L3D4_9ZZZZ